MDENTIENIKEKAPKQSLISELYDYVEVFVFAACVVLLTFTFIFRICRVDGQSMQHTLEPDEKLITSALFYEPAAGDIVVFHQTGDDDYGLNKPLVKRVIALGGQYVKTEYELVLVEDADGDPVSEWKMMVYVSDDDTITPDELIDESYVYIEPDRMPPYSGDVCAVPKGCVFVMGDNRFNSLDSRSAVGCIDERRIIGKVILRMTPISKFGVVES